MDVDAENFEAQLPQILEAISRSAFVAIDFELSGIPRRQYGKAGSRGSGKQTLQQRYAEAKAAAEKYQILQFGLTCVEKQPEHGLYTLRPYNFFLSPLIDKRLKIDRDFVYQGGAIDFLLSHEFPMDRPFQGVPYLSFQEEAAAREIAETEWTRNVYEDITLRPDDVENINLLRRAREDIDAWQDRNDTEEPLYIGTAGQDSAGSQGRGLNGFQKRLIHQLVRAEYPECVSFPKSDMIQIVSFDSDREDEQLARKRRGFENNLTMQIGLRWIIEAISSNDFHVESTFDSVTSSLSPIVSPDQDTDIGQETVTTQVKKAVQRAQVPAVVGHNCFMDLIFLYSCFIGPLSATVEGFMAQLHYVFPTIMDTKYIADNLNNNSGRYGSSLEELALEYCDDDAEQIILPPEFSRYETEVLLHEAGFDSWLTAKILIQLALRTDERAFSGQGENAIDDFSKTRGREESMTKNLLHSMNFEGINDGDNVGASRSKSPDLIDLAHGAAPKPSTVNGDLISPLIENLTISPKDNPCVSPLDNPQSFNASVETQQDKYSILPKSEGADSLRLHRNAANQRSQFWTKYSNKLRVNGTVEEFCDLRGTT